MHLYFSTGIIYPYNTSIFQQCFETEGHLGGASGKKFERLTLVIRTLSVHQTYMLFISSCSAHEAIAVSVLVNRCSVGG